LQQFFFSSRRRHTRSYGDWSSDVCSSDLVEEHDVRIPDGYRDWLPMVADIERAVAVAALVSAPCHNDLLSENFIDDGVSLRIVHSERTGNDDPCFDLGTSSYEAEFDQELRAAL